MIEDMLVVCAWCRKHLGVTGDPDDQITSHGMCDACASHLEASTYGIPLRQFLDSLDVPVTLVDDNVRVVYANPSTHALLKKSHAAIEHQFGGNVFECENSYQPGGCGKTASCTACTLRNAVTRCYKSGQAEDGLVATLTRRTDGGVVDFSMRISTRRINDQVLVKIDEIVG